MAIAVYFVFFAGTDEEKIRKCVAELARAVEVKADDTNVVMRGARLRGKLAEVLTEDVHVSVEELQGGKVTGRDPLVQRAAAIPAMYRTLEVNVHDYDIKVHPSGAEASVGARATVSATPHGGDAKRDERAIDLLMRKDEGRWRVSSITVWGPDRQ